MKDYEEIQAQLTELMRPLVASGIDIEAETDLVADLGLDSMAVMKLLQSVEDNFDISIPLNILSDVRTVNDLIFQLQKLTGEGL